MSYHCNNPRNQNIKRKILKLNEQNNSKSLIAKQIQVNNKIIEQLEYNNLISSSTKQTQVNNKILSPEQAEELTNQAVKNCPLCNKPTFLDGGCNYMRCSNSDPPSICIAEWCWQCHKIKYKPIPGRENEGCCNDLSHNSH